MIEIILVLVLWLYIVLQLLVLSGFAMERPEIPELKEMPEVDILIPARNEAAVIENCIRSALQLNYPKNLYRIFVGNDHSSDETEAIIKKLSEEYPQVHLVNIDGNIGSARAKGNVLAHLMQVSTARYVFVTDADITLNPEWINSLLPRLMKKDMGIVSGTTVVDGTPLFEKLQGLEWSLGCGYLIGLDQLGLKSTAVGNNMCFTRDAYEATGGYQRMKFSVTEDFQLFSAIRKNGFYSQNLIEPESLNISKAQSQLVVLLHQRKRWMIGAQDLPWYWIFIFGLQAIFYPALFLLMFIHVDMALDVWLIKVLLQSFYLALIHRRTRRKLPILSFLLFEPYTLLMQLAMIGFYLWPVSMQWKDRKY